MDDEDLLANILQEEQELKSKNTQLATALATSAFQGQEDANLIQFQIDTAEMLNKIEHFLRGEYITTDPSGNEYWTKPMKKVLDKNGKPMKDKDGKDIEEVDQSRILLNDYGVNLILSILGNYLDKNTILSYYDERRINEILADFADKLAEEIFNTYEKIGLDSDFKKTRYPLIVLTIVHTVESAYRRALHGKTMEDLNSSKIFTQVDQIGNRGVPTKKRHRSPFKPSTW